MTILRLGLAGQRRETAEATRWLEDEERGLLSLWWQEAAGELSRAELEEVVADISTAPNPDAGLVRYGIVRDTTGDGAAPVPQQSNV